MTTVKPEINLGTHSDSALPINTEKTGNGYGDPKIKLSKEEKAKRRASTGTTKQNLRKKQSTEMLWSDPDFINLRKQEAKLPEKIPSEKTRKQSITTRQQKRDSMENLKRRGSLTSAPAPKSTKNDNGETSQSSDKNSRWLKRRGSASNITHTQSNDIESTKTKIPRLNLEQTKKEDKATVIDELRKSARSLQSSIEKLKEQFSSRSKEKSPQLTPSTKEKDYFEKHFDQTSVNLINEKINFLLKEYLTAINNLRNNNLTGYLETISRIAESIITVLYQIHKNQREKESKKENFSEENHLSNFVQSYHYFQEEFMKELTKQYISKYGNIYEYISQETIELNYKIFKILDTEKSILSDIVIETEDKKLIKKITGICLVMPVISKMFPEKSQNDQQRKISSENEGNQISQLNENEKNVILKTVKKFALSGEKDPIVLEAVMNETKLKLETIIKRLEDQEPSCFLFLFYASTQKKVNELKSLKTTINSENIKQVSEIRNKINETIKNRNIKENRLRLFGFFLSFFIETQTEKELKKIKKTIKNIKNDQYAPDLRVFARAYYKRHVGNTPPETPRNPNSTSSGESSPTCPSPHSQTDGSQSNQSALLTPRPR